MNCKPGDMAYVVRSGDPDMIGKPVTVLQIDEFHTARWGAPAWIIECDPFKGSHPGGHRKVKTSHPDAWLRPISGVPVDDEVKDEVPA